MALKEKGRSRLGYGFLRRCAKTGLNVPLQRGREGEGGREIRGRERERERERDSSCNTP